MIDRDGGKWSRGELARIGLPLPRDNHGRMMLATAGRGEARRKRPGPAAAERHDSVLPEIDMEDKVRVGLEPDDFVMDPEKIGDTIHLVAQSKGGTGKTFVASSLASFFQRHAGDHSLYCLDLDSNKKSFSAFKSFNPTQISDVKNVDGEIVIDKMIFDNAFGMLMGQVDEKGIVIMDTGAGNSFWSVISYIAELDYPSLINAYNRKLRFIIHVVISGSAIQESLDTIKRLKKYVTSPYVEYVIWLNEYFGPLKEVRERILREYGETFNRFIKLPAVTNSSLDKTLRMMREENRSVSEMLSDPAIGPLDKTRYTRFYYNPQESSLGIFRALQRMDWSRKCEGGAEPAKEAGEQAQENAEERVQAQENCGDRAQ